MLKDGMHLSFEETNSVSTTTMSSDFRPLHDPDPEPPRWVDCLALR